MGVNAIWINPMILSNQKDKGYDVIDYKKVDPLFGTEAESDALIKEIHDRGMNVIFDFPLNHTSDQHPWFQEALKGEDNSYRPYYIWADPKEDGSHPNNWTAAFGGSAWSKELNGNQYYLHLFMDSMPDVNWDHPLLRKEMADVLNYWIDKGIDGFRLDAFTYIDVNKEFPEHPDEMGSGQDLNEHGENIQAYLREMEEEIAHKEKDVFIVGEATSADTELVNWYTDTEKNLTDKIITMQYFPEKEEHIDEGVPEGKQHLPLDVAEFKNIQKAFQEQQKESGISLLFWNNHDMPRSQHKYGDADEHRSNAAKMMAALLYLQKGIPIIYYGEEIGMKNLSFDDPGNISDAGVQEFYEAARKAGWSHEEAMHHLNLTARDVSRGIMQRDASEKVGFTEGLPWTLYNREPVYNVKDQEKDENSILHFYRRLLQLKKTDVFQKGAFKLLGTTETTYVYTRTLDEESALVCCNFSNTPASLKLTDEWQAASIMLQNEGNRLAEGRLHLALYGAVVFGKQ
ncbi:alpha-amylase family glycosyl hydrolase [Atopococcus tabaci]|uniref:alpha-amylase family glycosyl hydrolase n=1 Tax=Atopococcus tabaci TaxID=269774 RepID=UPI00240A786C|nr:alpha-amylase family glycosyl hydrolase [Atopococcus tabaci]